MINFIKRFFERTPEAKEGVKLDERQSQNYDPLDVTARHQGWKAAPPNPIQRDISAFPVAARAITFVGDSAAMDDNGAGNQISGLSSNYAVPEQLQNWFMSQSFIGYQSCAIIAQHWLVDKACSMAGEDAIRHGWDINAIGSEDELAKEDHDKLRSFDVPYKLKANLAELDRFKNVFGIRIAIFQVDSDDKDYYEKPFNIDGVTEGSYKGISQIDPYWMMPTMTSESTSDPASMNFYDPEYWVISGKKYHRSHLIIARGPQPADVLKPTYIFGGIPLTQRIYERVYAAERTANEAPLLSLSKRTTALHVDVEKAITNQEKFEQKLMFWVKYRDNHAVKVLGKEESMEQFDTSLSDFDSIIMNQYQLVSAIAKVPSTKLLGTSPKGFSATGEFEMLSYHEELESVQEHTMAPMIERHYLLLGKSLGIKCKIEVVFAPVDSTTALQQAELNDKKADTDQKNITMGAVAPDEVRDRLRTDKHSGYNHLSDEEAESEPGASPENIAEFEKAGQESAPFGGAPASPAVAEPIVAPVSPAGNEEQDATIQAQGLGAVVAPNTAVAKPDNSELLLGTVKILLERVQALESAMIPNNTDINPDASPATERTAKPSVVGLEPSVAAIGAVLPQMDPAKHPKMKVSGMLLSIENPRGTIRQGMDLDGSQWSQKMPHHYGFIRGIDGADGDELDCFVGQNLLSDLVFVINQLDPSSGEFDEHKVMLGFDSFEEAKAAYHAAYSTDWEGFGSMVPLSMDEFKERLKNGDVFKLPLADPSAQEQV